MPKRNISFSLTERSEMPIARASLAGLCLLALLALSLPARAQDKGAESTQSKSQEVKIDGLTLVVPAEWTREEPANRLRLAQFQMPKAEGDEQPTELVVSYFGGRAGGVDANVRRWIGQFASAGRTANVVKGESPQGTYYLVDISGTYNMPVGPPIRRQTKELPNARMLAIILQVEGRGNYFLKMAGPEKSVSAQRDALRASIRGDQESEKPYEVK